MGGSNLPKPQHAVLDIKDFFEWKSKVIENHEQGREGIAMVQDSNDKKYYVIAYHKAGFIICNYDQAFDTRFPAMVVYEKFRKALIAGGLERYWHDLLEAAKKSRKL